jgi:hypothetical protein
LLVGLWAILRDVLTGEEGDDHPKPGGTSSALDRTTHGCCPELIRCVDPEELENELTRIDGFLAERRRQ